MEIPTYEELYQRCMSASYVHTNEGGSWAVQHIGCRLYLLLQWSNGTTDWINNFDFPAKPYKDMPTTWKAHRGFVRVWKSIEPEIASYVVDPTVKEIIIIGYSHGASLAVLAHEYCWFNRPDIRAAVYGFGFEGARVFHGKIPKELKERWENFTLIRNGSDLVTHVPPYIFGFKHVGTLLQVNPDKVYPVKHRALDCINAHYQDNVTFALHAYDQEHPKI